MKQIFIGFGGKPRARDIESRIFLDLSELVQMLHLYSVATTTRILLLSTATELSIDLCSVGVIKSAFCFDRSIQLFRLHRLLSPCQSLPEPTAKETPGALLAAPTLEAETLSTVSSVGCKFQSNVVHAASSDATRCAFISQTPTATDRTTTATTTDPPTTTMEMVAPPTLLLAERSRVACSLAALSTGCLWVWQLRWWWRFLTM